MQSAPEFSQQDLGGSRAWVRDLYERPFFIPLAQGSANLALYAGMAWIVALPAWQPLSFAVWPLMGLILAGFLAAAHDCVHDTLFHPKAKMSNRIAGAPCGMPLVINYTGVKNAPPTAHRF